MDHPHVSRRTFLGAAAGAALVGPRAGTLPDVLAVTFDYGGLPVYLRLNLGTAATETYRFHGAHGVLELTNGDTVTVTPQTGEDARFGHHAALACHMANASHLGQHAVTWDAAARTIWS